MLSISICSSITEFFQGLRSIAHARQCVSDLYQKRIQSPQDLISLLRVQAMGHHALSITAAKVFALHLVHYLEGSGHPDGLEPALLNLYSTLFAESTGHASTLRARLFMHAIADQASLPSDPKQRITVGKLFHT
jgi:hypothetical protein